ncbi:MAG: ABC transporter substrate-binding protein [Rhizobiaceae bacterium]
MKTVLQALFAAALMATATTSLHAQEAKPAAETGQTMRKVKFLLNSGFSGANAWFILADDRGYFRDEGLEVEFVDGKGAFTAAGRMATEGYDFGYGDFQAIVERAAADPKTSPVGVYMLMDRSPSVVVVPTGSKVKEPKDLEKLTITGHPTDVGLNTFEQYASKAGIDRQSVTVVGNDGDWKTLLGEIKEGRADALFGYYSTVSAAVRSAGQDVASEVRFLQYPHVVPELYGSVVMTSQTLAKDDPDVVKGFLRAINRGVLASACDPDAAIEALVKRDPKRIPAVERGRLVDTVVEDMGGKATLASGVGGIDANRMEALLKLTAETRKLARQPAVAEVFSDTFLPDVDDRKAAVGAAPCKPL